MAQFHRVNRLWDRARDSRAGTRLHSRASSKLSLLSEATVVDELTGTVNVVVAAKTSERGGNAAAAAHASPYTHSVASETVRRAGTPEALRHAAVTYRRYSPGAAVLTRVASAANVNNHDDDAERGIVGARSRLVKEATPPAAPLALIEDPVHKSPSIASLALESIKSKPTTPPLLEDRPPPQPPAHARSPEPLSAPTPPPLSDFTKFPVRAICTSAHSTRHIRGQGLCTRRLV